MLSTACSVTMEMFHILSDPIWWLMSTKNESRAIEELNVSLTSMDINSHMWHEATVLDIPKIVPYRLCQSLNDFF